MENAFERLGVERSLVLDEGALRAAFDGWSGELHPDMGGSPEEFARLREAFDLLLSPARRLRHWLETGGVEWHPGGSVPAVLLEMFGLIGDLIQRADGLAGRKTAAQSALGRSMLEREGIEVLGEIEARMESVRGMREGLVGSFGAFESAGAVACGGEAVEVARTLTFLEKWESQLRERWAALAM